MLTPNAEVITFLQTRRSRPAKTLTTPVPNQAELKTLLTMAARTPDHGKLEPWRFIVLGKRRLTELTQLVDQRAQELGLDPDKAQKGKNQFQDCHLGVVVIEVQKPSEKIPAIEQTYSAGAVCLSLVNAALASGWGANWLSGWPNHDRSFVTQAFDLTDQERVAGIIYLGTETATPPERPRPDMERITTWQLD